MIYQTPRGGVDPITWASTPGMGRAPLLPGPEAPGDAALQLAALLLRGSGKAYVPEAGGPVSASDRIAGALTRPTGQMGMGQLFTEQNTIGGAFGSPEARLATRAPAMAAGALSGIPGLGFVMGGMAKAGVNNRLRDLQNEAGRRIGRAYSAQETGGHQTGRKRARSYTPERESRGGGDHRDSYQGGEVGAGGWAGSGGL